MLRNCLLLELYFPFYSYPSCYEIETQYYNHKNEWGTPGKGMPLRIWAHGVIKYTVWEWIDGFEEIPVHELVAKGRKEKRGCFTGYSRHAKEDTR